MVRIVFSKIARFDLKEIVDYIKRDSIKYALLEKKNIIHAIDKLSYQPLIGKQMPEMNSSYRELIFGNYLVIYKIVSDNQVNILTIHHHARSLSNNPAFNDED
ncbi:MAG: type II toxin-antitoxin system RelE/ParE family toxin [Mucilaginibacter sp.]